MRHYFHLFVITTFIFLSYTPHVFAQNFNESTIRDFVETMTAITNGQHEMKASEITSFFDQHLPEKGEYKSLISYEIPGFSRQERPLLLNKKQFIEAIITGQQHIRNFESKIEIIAINIAENTKSAKIETRSVEKGLLTLPDESGTEETIQIEGISMCEQILISGDNGLIQIDKADCKTVIKLALPTEEALEDYEPF